MRRRHARSYKHRMSDVLHILNAHPGAWLVLIAIGILLVLRLLAKLACLATIVVGVVIVLGFAGAVTKGVL